MIREFVTTLPPYLGAPMLSQRSRNNISLMPFRGYRLFSKRTADPQQRSQYACIDAAFRHGSHCCVASLRSRSQCSEPIGFAESSEPIGFAESSEPIGFAESSEPISFAEHPRPETR